jgi:hypothetical protein
MMKSLSKEERVRSKAYLASVRGLPCLICGAPSDPHHLQRAQPRALSMKTGDQFVVLVCRPHHEQIHAFGDETLWWALNGVDPIEWAKRNWEQWLSQQ